MAPFFFLIFVGHVNAYTHGISWHPWIGRGDAGLVVRVVHDTPARLVTFCGTGDK